MAVTVSGTSITFNDATVQTTAASAYTGPRQQVFSSSGTFTVPTGVTSLNVVVWGGGAGGRGGTVSLGYNQTYGGQPGGNGGIALANITGLTPGATVTVTVGSGSNGTLNASTPSTGGTSSFGAYISCTGGAGAAAGLFGVNGAASFSGATKTGVNPGVAGTGNLGDYQSFSNCCGTFYALGGGGGGAGMSAGGGGGCVYAALGNPGTGGTAVYTPGSAGSNGTRGLSNGTGGSGGAGGGANGGAGATGTSGGNNGGGGGGGGGVVVFW